ncbi:TIGR03086 family metal-binding protein [Actinacidiphila rubida]|uniref:TIGR03086 family protein n=1 Tax=Actinacidiphila rubida TaxID=310780 RepID=A0A1H8RKI7_9ACTN|nr:TIGR03086 family metal-binding protein [Actinacidiphila rubida]SEO66981.1 TIGR03086 family protein [Actinacidiphila rubida]
MTYHAQLAAGAAEAARITSGVTAAQLGAPTPCPDYDTRTLANHLVAYTGIGMELRARREPHPEDLATRDFTADPGWAAAYAAQLERSVDAWADPAAWEGEISGMPAPAMGGMLLLELVLHGWDLARATGQEYRLDGPTAAATLGLVREQAEMYRQYKGFGEPVEVPAGAPDLDLALALSGRDPHWAP